MSVTSSTSVPPLPKLANLQAERRCNLATFANACRASKSSRRSDFGGSVLSGASTARASTSVRDGRHGCLPAALEDGVGLEIWASRGEVRGKFGNKSTQLSLDADTSGKKRYGDQIGRQYRNCLQTPRSSLLSAAGSLSARVPATATLAGAGPLSMPDSGAGRKKVSGADERWLDMLRAEIFRKAGERHSTVQKALLSLDADDDGIIGQSEVEYFFRRYDLPVTKVSALMEYLDAGSEGCVDYQTFINFMGAAVKGNAPHSLGPGSSMLSTREPTPVNPSDAQEEANRKAEFEQQFGQLFEYIRTKAMQRFRKPRDAFKLLDCDKDNRISRSEMRNFGRALMLGDNVADELLQFFDAAGDGEANYDRFVEFLSPHLRATTESTSLWASHDESECTPKDTVNFHASLRSDAPLSASCEQWFSMESQSPLQERAPVRQQIMRERLRAIMGEIKRMPIKAGRYPQLPKLSTIGVIGRLEARSFMVSAGWSARCAELFFGILVEDGGDLADYSTFMELFREACKLRNSRNGVANHYW